jgi:hypothetical protein
MKRMHSLTLIATLMLVGVLAASPGWGSRVFTDTVSGQITATPISDVIEVDHHVYRVKRGSNAAESLHEFAEGQKVQLVLDGPIESNASEVLFIKLKEASQ